MRGSSLYLLVDAIIKDKKIDSKNHKEFRNKLIGKIELLDYLFKQLYSEHQNCETSFKDFIEIVIAAYLDRSPRLKERDKKKQKENGWFLSNELIGMSLYVDKFAGDLKEFTKKTDYLQDLGVNFLHLMPLFESPKEKSDGGYAVSNYRKIDERFGSLDDLVSLQESLQKKDMYLMLDIVLNHTSDEHEWAQKAKQGDTYYQDFYYMYDDRIIPNQMEIYMPDVFPESSPGNFTYDEEMGKWVMTVFHNYQWDLNFTNPEVFKAMLKNIFFYANLGVDVLRIDAPAFIWKQMGTTCQNLPEAHIILQIIKASLEIATPGMAILGEAIVAPRQIMKYFGEGFMTTRECDIAYNASQMALQWDALATTDTRNMLCNQEIISQKPVGTTWINYTRCHDDIGLSFEDSCIEKVGFTPYLHRDFIKNYYSGKVAYSRATGALFGVNSNSNDARISGTLASLCGLEKALENNEKEAISLSVNKILLMQANSILLGGIPMIFYGDEVGYTNDYSYKDNPDTSYDNRWMHRPVIDWKKNKRVQKTGTIEHSIFTSLQRLISIRKEHYIFSDRTKVEWLESYNRSIVGFKKSDEEQTIYCLFNYNQQPQNLTFSVFKALGDEHTKLFDLWSEKSVVIRDDFDNLSFKPYQFYIFKVRN